MKMRGLTVPSRVGSRMPLEPGSGVQVCAEGTDGEQEAIRYQTEDETGECTTSSGAAASGVT